MTPLNGNGSSQNGPASDAPATGTPRPEPSRIQDVRNALQQTQDVFGSGDPFAGDPTPQLAPAKPAAPRASRPTYAQTAARKEAAANQNLRLLKGALAASTVALLVSIALVFDVPDRLAGNNPQAQMTSMLQADSLMGAGNYEAARERFLYVLKSQPENVYVQQRLAQLERLQSAEAQLSDQPGDQFDRLVAQGDSLSSLLRTVGVNDPLLTEQISAGAREAYLRALVYRPDDQHVREKLTQLVQGEASPEPSSAGEAADAERRRLQAEQLELYRLAIEQGDQFLARGEYLEAQIRFKEALIYQKDDTYAAQRLEMIDGLWQEANQNERFDGYRQRGDELLQANLFDQARAAYREALSVRPGDMTILGRLADADRLERQAEQQLAQERERERQYQQLLIRGDALTGAGQYQEAYDHYLAAFQEHPGDPELEKRVEAVQNRLNRQQQVDENGVYKYLAENERPTIIGTLGDLYARIEYPASAVRTGLEGRVYVEFIVDEQGAVQTPRILRGLSPDCDREVLRVIRTARFNPARVDGRPVKAHLTLPITFRIADAVN